MALSRQLQQITLQKRSLEKLKCTVCKGYLSVPPVDLNREVCGRCNSSLSRSEAYEELAQYFLFPCIYPECNEKISWGKVKEHEERCIHKTFLCPVKNCDDVYKISSTNNHFQKKHRQLHHDGHTPLKIIVESRSGRNSDRHVYHVTFERHSFLVFVRGVLSHNNDLNHYHNNIFNHYDIGSNFQKMKYCFGVFALNPDFHDDCKFEVTITLINKDGKSVSYTQRNKKIEHFDERNKCLKCIDNTNECKVKYHHTKGKNFLLVNFDELDIANSRGVYYQIDIKPNGVTDSSDQSTSRSMFNKDIAKKLECPICTQYMMAPIYICETGHSICGKCKRSVRECPYCRAPVGNKRNFILEELAETINVPCPNVQFGCEFIGEIISIKNHEKTCSYSIQSM